VVSSFVEPVMKGQHSGSEVCVCESSLSQTLRLYCINFFSLPPPQPVNDIFLDVMACTCCRGRCVVYDGMRGKMPFDIHAVNCSHFHLITSQFHSKNIEFDFFVQVLFL
jgi:hypothetical protein